MHASTRKLDRLRAFSGSNCGWSTDSLVTGPDKHIEKQNRLRACSRINLGWLAEGLGTGQTNAADERNRMNLGWPAERPMTGQPKETTATEKRNSLSRPPRNLIGEQLCFGRSILACKTQLGQVSQLSPLRNRLNKLTESRSKMRLTNTYICPRPERNLTGGRRCFGRSNLACLVVKTTAHLAKLEAENETQECSMVYIFSSLQPKSLRQTNLLLVHRRKFTFSLLCLTSANGLVQAIHG